jgi:hypothetical protein
VLSGAILTGCAADAPSDTRPYDVRDSVGVEIVTSHRGTWGPEEGWTVVSSPSLVIGQMEGDPAYELSSVRGALRLPDGRVVVAEYRTSEVRFYGPDGRHVRSVGRAGDGPGEFSSLFGIFTRGDTLFAHDFRQSRITVFDFQGEYLGDVTLDRSFGLPLEVHPVSNGYLGVLQGFPEEIPEEFTYSRRLLTYRIFNADGSGLRVVDELPGQEILFRGSVSGNVINTVTTTPLIAHSAFQAVVSGRLVAGTTDRFELRVYDEEGELRRLIRAPDRDRPVSGDEWDQVVAEAVAEAEGAEGRRGMRQLAELRSAPEVRPAYGRFVADAEGYVWVEPYRPAQGRAVPWTVVDPEGSVLGEVELAEGFRPLDIGSGHVLGIVRDDLGVPYVQLYELFR